MSEEGEAVAWLRRAVEARRALAVAAASVAGPEWRHDHYWPDDESRNPTTMILSAAGSPLADTLHRDDEEMAPHIVANDPRQVIADCEKDLAILNEHGQRDGSIWCRTCDPAREDMDDSASYYPCRTVRLVASGYKYWPGHEETWGTSAGRPA